MQKELVAQTLCDPLNKDLHTKDTLFLYTFRVHFLLLLQSKHSKRYSYASP